MPGNVTHANVVPGQTLTANKYNGDFQNIIDNMTPQGVDDFAVNAAQFLTIQDPGEPGSEILPTSLAGELAALRWILSEIKGTTWIQTVTGKARQPQFAFEDPVFGGWVNSADRTMTFWLSIPQDYHSGQLTLGFLSQMSSGFGNVRMVYAASWWRAGTTPVVVDVGVSAILPFPSTSIVFNSFTLSSAAVAFGDMIIMTAQRTPGHVDDTATGDLAFVGANVTYNGWAGR